MRSARSHPPQPQHSATALLTFVVAHVRRLGPINKNKKVSPYAEGETDFRLMINKESVFDTTLKIHGMQQHAKDMKRKITAKAKKAEKAKAVKAQAVAKVQATAMAEAKAQRKRPRPSEGPSAIRYPTMTLNPSCTVT